MWLQKKPFNRTISVISQGFEYRLHTGIIFIDLLKVFDTKNHKILLDKHPPIGFSNNTISWYGSYLEERHFIVEVTNWVSKFANISCGGPQGSMLGPVLFLLYIKDMSQTV